MGKTEQKKSSVENKSEKRLGVLNVLVIFLSVYVLIALMADTFFDLPKEISHVLHYIDNFICIFFLLDFSIRFYRAENKWKFMRWGWIDLISSIPTFDLFRYGRAIRLIKLLRILRGFKSIKHLTEHLFANRTKGSFTTIALLALTMVFFSSIIILQFENVPESNIKTGEDAIWWSFTTITTVGYGDKYPVTTGGRMVAIVLMCTGVGMFGVLSATLASWFVAGRNKEMQEEIIEKMEEEIEEEMEELKHEMKKNEKAKE